MKRNVGVDSPGGAYINMEYTKEQGGSTLNKYKICT